MGLFGRRKTDSGTPKSSGLAYDDVEQLLMQVGIIGAFMLSISMPLEHQVLPGSMDGADFNGLVCFHQEFREYVVDRLEAKGFVDWQIPYNKDAALDAKAELLVNIGARLPNGDEHYFRDCYADLKLSTVVMYLTPEFDMRLMCSYILMVGMGEGGEWASPTAYLSMASFSAQMIASLTTAFFFLNIIIFCLLYVSLAMSSAREDPTGKALEAWRKVGMSKGQ